jgi:hypothetical protein
MKRDNSVGKAEQLLLALDCSARVCRAKKAIGRTSRTMGDPRPAQPYRRLHGLVSGIRKTSRPDQRRFRLPSQHTNMAAQAADVGREPASILRRIRQAQRVMQFAAATTLLRLPLCGQTFAQ